MAELAREIVDYVERRGYKPLGVKGLGKKLGIRKKGIPAFTEVLDELLTAGSVRQDKHGYIRPKAATGLVGGIVKRINSGAGFVIPHPLTEAATPPTDRPPLGDIFIDARDMLDAHSGDEVLVQLVKKRRSGGQRCGRIEEIVERAATVFVGTYFEKDGQGFVLVDGTTFSHPILVGDPGAKGVQPDDKVVVEMLRFPSKYQTGEAVLTKVLGPRGEPGVDLLSIIHEFGLPHEFPEEALEEARHQADEFKEKITKGRLDLTGETIVTIDPADARDFDDAISLTKQKDGGWRLGIHIADVAHFVQPGSPLDQEALNRSTSVYLPGHVIPMLPEVLSNGLASLQAGKMRYVKSVFIDYDAEGMPTHTKFARSAIKVTRRFAYKEVLPIIQDPEKSRSQVSADIRKLLSNMYELAMKLRARRFAAGALELHLGEVKIDLDKEGQVAGAHEAVHDESHQIIEEFMLAANVAVATKFNDMGISFLRRVHGDPDVAKLKTLSQFVKALGYSLEQYQSRHHLQELINQVSGQSEEHAVNFALLRSMKRAEYTGTAIGHYALAVDNYCHFTSPIRRYPDLTIHRLFDDVIDKKAGRNAISELELVKLGRHCSATERRAASAERELIKVKLLTYMSGRIGDELSAIITGVESFGIFCMGVEIPVEGLVHISSLQDDYYTFDANNFCVTGSRTGRQFRLGDQVVVRVAHVDVDRRQLDFRVVEQKSPSRNRFRDSQESPEGRKKPRRKKKTLPAKKKKAAPKKKKKVRAKRRKKKR